MCRSEKEYIYRNIIYSPFFDREGVRVRLYPLVRGLRFDVYSIFGIHIYIIYYYYVDIDSLKSQLIKIVPDGCGTTASAVVVPLLYTRETGKL